MSMNHSERELNRLGDKDLAKIISGVKTAFQKRHPEMKDIALPGQLVSSKEAQAPKIDLRQQTFELLHLVVEPTAEEKEALRVKRGLVFLPMMSQSYAQVVAVDQEHFWKNELDYANSHADLRDYIPPVAAEVGLIEAELALPGSFRKSRNAHLQLIEDYSQELQTEFPDFRAVMLPATGYASADLAYSIANPGQVLFKNYFARCLDNISEVLAAFAGRDVPSHRFDVGGWHGALGDDLVGAVPAVVKIDNK